MTENVNTVSPVETKNLLSEQEKRAYCRQWESSGIPKSDFCKKHELSVNLFYYWYKQFKKESTDKIKQFSPVVAKMTPSDPRQNMMQLEMRLPNQMQLFIPVRESNLVSFIQELCNAVTVVR